MLPVFSHSFARVLGFDGDVGTSYKIGRIHEMLHNNDPPAHANVEVILPILVRIPLMVTLKVYS